MVGKKAAKEKDEQSSLTRPQIAILSLAAGIVYFFSNPTPSHYYDYTFRVAGQLLRGSTGFTLPQPSWLNEFVPYGGYFYSVFPLGSVLTMVPAAALKSVGIINDMPSALLSALCAAGSASFMFLIANKYGLPGGRTILMTFGILFGTFAWTNLTMGGAWQLALGFAMLGGFGAIYFAVFDRRPFIAGAFFALAFGNRTEFLLTAPIFIFLLIRRNSGSGSTSLSEIVQLIRGHWRRVILFCTIPFILGILTLIYNFVRFGSFTDFGYSRIPGVLQEPWYRHGIFSVWYIPGQIWEMLFKPWEYRPTFPYLRPNGFSSSILISSPFIIFALRSGARDATLKCLSWCAILLLCTVLWMHGNSGGWQFGYRYAMVCLPWLFVILLESSPKRISGVEWSAYAFAFFANAYATWLFHWTGYMKQ